MTAKNCRPSEPRTQVGIGTDGVATAVRSGTAVVPFIALLDRAMNKRLADAAKIRSFGAEVFNALMALTTVDGGSNLGSDPLDGDE